MKVYISAPYRATTKEQILDNIKMAAEYGLLISRISNGMSPVIPHVIVANRYGVSIEHNDGPSNAEIEKMCIDLLNECKMLFVCGDNITAGMQAEINHAIKIGIPISRLSTNWLLDSRSIISPVTREYGI